MNFDQQFDVVTDRFAHRSHFLYSQIFRCAINEDAAMLKRIALKRRQTLVDVIHSVLNGLFYGGSVPASISPYSVS